MPDYFTCHFSMTRRFKITVHCFFLQTVPASFIRDHAEKFKSKVRLGYGENKPRCEVGVNVYIMKEKHAHVSFGGWWKEFARAHGFQKGDLLKFVLVEESGFIVTPAPTTSAANTLVSSGEE